MSTSAVTYVLSYIPRGLYYTGKEFVPWTTDRNRARVFDNRGEARGALYKMASNDPHGYSLRDLADYAVVKVTMAQQPDTYEVDPEGEFVGIQDFDDGMWVADGRWQDDPCPVPLAHDDPWDFWATRWFYLRRLRKVPGAPNLTEEIVDRAP